MWLGRSTVAAARSLVGQGPAAAGTWRLFFQKDLSSWGADLSIQDMGRGSGGEWGSAPPSRSSLLEQERAWGGAALGAPGPESLAYCCSAHPRGTRKVPEREPRVQSQGGLKHHGRRFSGSPRWEVVLGAEAERVSRASAVTAGPGSWWPWGWGLSAGDNMGGERWLTVLPAAHPSTSTTVSLRPLVFSSYSPPPTPSRPHIISSVNISQCISG